MRLDVYSHNVAVSDIGGQEGLEALFQFCRPLVEMGLERLPGGRFRQVPLKTYAAALADRSVFRFHVNQLDDLVHHLGNRGFTGDRLLVVVHQLTPHDFPAVEHLWISPKAPRDLQPSIIEYVLAQGPGKMVTLQTGKGKTFIAMWSSYQLGLRTLYTFKGGFVEKWNSDISTHFDLEAGELLVVRGSGGLVKLMEMALEERLYAKSVIISTRTMMDYIKDYETHNGKSKIYPVPAPEFHRTLGFGFHVKDELHMEFHLNFKMELYTHTLKTLALSATMTSSDNFKNRMYDIAYPVQKRNDGGGYDAYIAVSALKYQFENPKLVRYKGGTGAYSHDTFEKSLMAKKSTVLPNYLRLINFVVQNKFIRVREEGQKMLIFCYSVDLCTMVVEYLQKLHPTLNILRYCGTQGDSYDEFIEADIGVSTVLSAGTAVDIPNLRLTFMTTAIDSRQSNEQALGRTRKLVDFPEVTPEFLYLVCEDIDKHENYHRNKQEFFKGKVISHKELRIPFSI